MSLYVVCFSFLRFTFGPQHPASHGVLCCCCYFIGEYIVIIDCVIGYLHRGTEKLCEFKTLEQSLPYFDRLDYCSVLCNEHLLTLSFEYLIRCVLSLRLGLIRVLFIEFTRSFNGLLCIGCMLMDLGSLSPLLWAFEERDKIATMFDLLCGSRMHCAFICLLGCADDFSFGLFDYLLLICVTTTFLLDILDLIIVNNRILFLRLRGLSVFCLWDLCFNSISGCLARSLGIAWDLRLMISYDLYFLLILDFCICFVGDAFDRFLIRLFDMRMSMILCKQLLSLFFIGFVILFDFYFYGDVMIETIITMFYSIWCFLIPGITYASVEHPKGEYSILIVFSLGYCTRLRLRCADFIHLLLIDWFLRGFMLHDLVAFLGNIDVVFGSVDR